jgi:hypothetical protein
MTVSRETPHTSANSACVMPAAVRAARTVSHKANRSVSVPRLACLRGTGAIGGLIGFTSAFVQHSQKVGKYRLAQFLHNFQPQCWRLATFDVVELAKAWSWYDADRSVFDRRAHHA